MVQVSLDPYMPGGFMEDWMNWWNVVSPDLMQNNMEALKTAGTLCLHTLCKTRLLHYGLQPMVMFVGLFGEPSSGKSWILKMTETAFPDLILKSGTPEAIAESIQEQKVGVILWDEIAQLISQAKRRGYMSEFPTLMNQLYNTQSVYMRRRTAKTVEVPCDSYFASLMLTGLEEDYTGLSELFGRGFERRLTPVYLKGRLPKLPKSLDDQSPNAELLVRLRTWRSRLANSAFMVRLRGLEKLEEVVEPSEELQGSEAEVGWFDMVKRLLSGVLVDRVLSEVAEVSDVSERLPIQIKGVEVKIISDVQTIRHFQTVEEITKLYIIDATEDVTNEYAYALRAPLTYLAQCYTQFQPRGEVELAAYTMRVKRFLERCGGYTTKRNLSRWLRLYARRFDEVLKSLKQQGLIVERVLDRSTVIFDSSLEACALCRHYGTVECKYDPNREGFVKPLDKPPEDECFEPLGGE
jgi:hypothetical protein